MGINLKGIQYRIKRWFGLTDYDREQRRRKKTTDISLTEGLIDSLKIAPLMDLPVKLSARVAYFVYIVLVFALGFFFYQGFSTARQEKFLALSSSAGVCKTVPKIVSGVYKFDIFGNWEGSELFEVTMSIYSLTLNHLQYTNEEFADLSELALTQLEAHGITNYYELSLNLVFWMSWSINTVASANRQHFRLTGDAKTLYNQATVHLSGMSSQVPGRCNVSSSITFEKASGIYRISYSYKEFVAIEACMQVADPRSLNYVPELGTDDFTIEFDVQSVMTALGVNYGIIDYEVLQEVPHTRSYFYLDGEYVEYAQYYNSRYPNMNPLTCFPHMNTSSVEYGHDQVDTCSIEVGITPMFPVFNHIGYAPVGNGQPEGGGSVETLYCDCSDEIMSNSSLTIQCEQFFMMTGFIFYNAPFEDNTDVLPEPLVKLSKLLTEKYPGDEGKAKLNKDAYNISKEAIHFSGTDNYFTSSGRDHFYDFCVIEGSPCSIITIYMNTNNRRFGVSEDYYQIVHGHCNDTVTVSAEVKEKFSVPPVPLVENYLECRRTLTAALFASGGIAVGNVLSVKSALVLFFSFWLARYTTTKKSSKQDTGRGGGGGGGGQAADVRFATYGLIERDKVLQYLAFNLLLARDGKYQGDTGEKLESNSNSSSSSLVTTLAEELKTHPNLKRFFRADGDRDGAGVEVVNSYSGDVNPLQQHNADDIEMTSAGINAGSGTSSSSSTNTAHKGKDNLWSNLSISFSRRNKVAFEEDLLLNPMFVKQDS